MGAVQSSARSLLGHGQPEIQVVVLGLDAAGKTTLLYRLTRSEITTQIPTIGFNFDSTCLGNMRIMCWDLGGRCTNRPLWRHLFQGSKGLVFVADSNDRERIDDAREELNRILAEELMRDVPLLVFANKQDLPNSMSVEEVTIKLGLHSLRDRMWHIQGSVASTGDGLQTGLDWLSHTISRAGAQKQAEQDTCVTFGQPRTWMKQLIAIL